MKITDADWPAVDGAQSHLIQQGDDFFLWIDVAMAVKVRIAQALVENVPVVTPDESFNLYEGLKVVW